MKERPILFSAPMVRAILEGRKTQTRRVCKVQPEPGNIGSYGFGQPMIRRHGAEPLTCPYGKPGDRLYVREAYIVSASFDALPPRELSRDAAIHYLADGEAPAWFSRGRYRHARFMPRWASRINLEVTGVRVERLQEISEADAQAEGVAFTCPQCGNDLDDPEGAECHWQCDDDDGSHREGFRRIWHAINGEESWELNPWLWVVEFKRVTQ